MVDRPRVHDEKLRPTRFMLQLQAEIDALPADQYELRVRLLEKLADMKLEQYKAHQRSKARRKHKPVNKNMVREPNAYIKSRMKKKPVSETQDTGSSSFDNLFSSES